MIRSIRKMRQSGLGLLMLAALAAGCQPRLAERARGGEVLRVTVMTYNVLGGRNTDGARDFERIAEVISTIDPDVVALQEVDRGTARLGGRDLAIELAERLKMRLAFGPAMPYDGGQYGVAILSRLPIERIENHPLPFREGSEPRTVLVAHLRGEGGTRFFVASTHLDHQQDPADRVAQAKRLVEVLGGLADTPGILAGDLNAEPGSEPMAIVESAWRDTHGPIAAAPTYPSTGPERRIDYVMVSPAWAWRVIRVHTGADLQPRDRGWRSLLGQASDHLPVVVVLEMSIRRDDTE